MKSLGTACLSILLAMSAGAQTTPLQPMSQPMPPAVMAKPPLATQAKPVTASKLSKKAKKGKKSQLAKKAGKKKLAKLGLAPKHKAGVKAGGKAKKRGKLKARTPAVGRAQPAVTALPN